MTVGRGRRRSTFGAAFVALAVAMAAMLGGSGHAQTIDRRHPTGDPRIDGAIASILSCYEGEQMDRCIATLGKRLGPKQCKPGLSPQARRACFERVGGALCREDRNLTINDIGVLVGMKAALPDQYQALAEKIIAMWEHNKKNMGCTAR